MINNNSSSDSSSAFSYRRNAALLVSSDDEIQDLRRALRLTLRREAHGSPSSASSNSFQANNESDFHVTPPLPASPLEPFNETPEDLGLERLSK